MKRGPERRTGVSYSDSLGPSETGSTEENGWRHCLDVGEWNTKAAVSSGTSRP